jgi:hypothetical protein
MFEYNRAKLKLNNFLCRLETEATIFPLLMLPCLDSSFYSEESENAQEADTGCLFLTEVSLSLLIVTQPYQQIGLAELHCYIFPIRWI